MAMTRSMPPHPYHALATDPCMAAAPKHRCAQLHTPHGTPHAPHTHMHSIYSHCSPAATTLQRSFEEMQLTGGPGAKPAGSTGSGAVLPYVPSGKHNTRFVFCVCVCVCRIRENSGPATAPRRAEQKGCGVGSGEEGVLLPPRGTPLFPTSPHSGAISLSLPSVLLIATGPIYR